MIIEYTNNNQINYKLYSLASKLLEHAKLNDPTELEEFKKKIDELKNSPIFTTGNDALSLVHDSILVAQSDFIATLEQNAREIQSTIDKKSASLNQEIEKDIKWLKQKGIDVSQADAIDVRWGSIPSFEIDDIDSLYVADMGASLIDPEDYACVVLSSFISIKKDDFEKIYEKERTKNRDSNDFDLMNP